MSHQKRETRVANCSIHHHHHHVPLDLFRQHFNRTSFFLLSFFIIRYTRVLERFRLDAITLGISNNRKKRTFPFYYFLCHFWDVVVCCCCPIRLKIFIFDVSMFNVKKQTPKKRIIKIILTLSSPSINFIIIQSCLLLLYSVWELMGKKGRK